MSVSPASEQVPGVNQQASISLVPMVSPASPSASSQPLPPPPPPPVLNQPPPVLGQPPQPAIGAPDNYSFGEIPAPLPPFSKANALTSEAVTTVLWYFYLVAAGPRSKEFGGEAPLVVNGQQLHGCPALWSAEQVSSLLGALMSNGCAEAQQVNFAKTLVELEQDNGGALRPLGAHIHETSVAARVLGATSSRMKQELTIALEAWRVLYGVLEPLRLSAGQERKGDPTRAKRMEGLPVATEAFDNVDGKWYHYCVWFMRLLAKPRHDLDDTKPIGDRDALGKIKILPGDAHQLQFNTHAVAVILRKLAVAYPANPLWKRMPKFFPKGISNDATFAASCEKSVRGEVNLLPKNLKDRPEFTAVLRELRDKTPAFDSVRPRTCLYGDGGAVTDANAVIDSQLSSLNGVETLMPRSAPWHIAMNLTNTNHDKTYLEESLDNVGSSFHLAYAVVGKTKNGNLKIPKNAKADVSAIWDHRDNVLEASIRSLLGRYAQMDPESGVLQSHDFRGSLKKPLDIVLYTMHFGMSFMKTFFGRSLNPSPTPVVGKHVDTSRHCGDQTCFYDRPNCGFKTKKPFQKHMILQHNGADPLPHDPAYYEGKDPTFRCPHSNCSQNHYLEWTGLASAENLTQHLLKCGGGVPADPNPADPADPAFPADPADPTDPVDPNDAADAADAADANDQAVCPRLSYQLRTTFFDLFMAVYKRVVKSGAADMYDKTITRFVVLLGQANGNKHLVGAGIKWIYERENLLSPQVI